MVDENKVKEADYKVVEPTKEQLESKGRMVSAMEEINAIQKQYNVALSLIAEEKTEGILVRLNMIDLKQPEAKETAETVADKIN